MGDYNDAGLDDLLVTYRGDGFLSMNLDKRKWVDIAAATRVTTRTTSGIKQQNTGYAFVDDDRVGHLDLFIANSINFDLKTAPLPTLRLSRSAGRQRRFVRQRGKRKRQGCFGSERHSQDARQLWPGSCRHRLRQRRPARYRRGQRLDFL